MEFETFLEFYPNAPMADGDFMDPNFWRAYYSQDWSSILSQNSLAYGDGESIAYALYVQKSPIRDEHLFSLGYSIWDRHNQHEGSCAYTSVGNDKQMSENNFIQLENDIAVPKGSFLGVSYVILTIISFLKKPEKLPNTVPWKNNGDIYLRVSSQQTN